VTRRDQATFPHRKLDLVSQKKLGRAMKEEKIVDKETFSQERFSVVHLSGIRLISLPGMPNIKSITELRSVF